MVFSQAQSHILKYQLHKGRLKSYYAFKFTYYSFRKFFLIPPIIPEIIPRKIALFTIMLYNTTNSIKSCQQQLISFDVAIDTRNI